jgi:hypothetical protein
LRHVEKGPKSQKSFDMKGYTFFIDSLYERNKDKESECLPVEPKKRGPDDLDLENKITFQVKDPIPVDYLDKMSDQERDLKLLGETIADDFLKNCEGSDAIGQAPPKRFLKASKPYVRKNNVTADLSLVVIWETWFRFNEFDLYITVMRRQYIPPIGDCYQDITICSKFKFAILKDNKGNEIEQTPEIEEKNNKASLYHLENYHRRIIDSIHTKNIGAQTSYFNVMLEARANALLMSEETMNFYQYNRKIRPGKVSHFAISYMLCLLNILLKYNKDNVSEFSKTIKKATTEYCPDYKETMKMEPKESQASKTAAKVVEEFNDFCLQKSEAEFKAEEKALLKAKSVAPVTPAAPVDDIPDVEINKSIHSDTPKDEAKAAEGQEGATPTPDEEAKGEEEAKKEASEAGETEGEPNAVM